MAKRRKKKLKIVERKLGRERAWGQYWTDGLIELDPRMLSKKYLRVLIHEGSHKLFPSFSETEIERIAKFLGDLIWNQNYRRIMK